MKQRGVTEIEIQHIFDFPIYVKKSFEEQQEIMGTVNNRLIKIEFIETETYIRIITVMVHNER